MADRGRVFVRFSWDVLGDILKGHPLCEVTSDLPADAEIEHIVLDDIRREARVHLTSASFAVVHEAEPVPEFQPVLTTWWPPKDGKEARNE